MHDMLYDAAFSVPETLIDCVPRLISHYSSPCTTSAPPTSDETADCPPIRGRISAPFATCARAMAATRVRRNAARRSRHLRNGQRLISFVVDSGCTWHIHPHLSDLVNVRACHDLVAGIDGRPQRCTAIGDLPICAMNESGQLVHVTLRNVRCAP
eukprot:4511888-Pleurochrysis_carterae.AAC.1